MLKADTKMSVSVGHRGKARAQHTVLDLSWSNLFSVALSSCSSCAFDTPGSCIGITVKDSLVNANRATVPVSTMDGRLSWKVSTALQKPSSLI